MAERDTTKKLIHAMKGWDAIRVENFLYPGTPDINFIGGWMEVKYIKKYPIKDSTIIYHHDFTIAQRAFLKRRALLGGKTFLFVTIENDHYLFDGITGADYFGFLEKQYLIKKAIAYWPKKFPTTKDLTNAVLGKTDHAEEKIKK